jgi:hypothetical protein
VSPFQQTNCPMIEHVGCQRSLRFRGRLPNRVNARRHRDISCTSNGSEILATPVTELFGRKGYAEYHSARTNIQDVL